MTESHSDASVMWRLDETTSKRQRLSSFAKSLILGLFAMGEPNSTSGTEAYSLLEVQTGNVVADWTVPYRDKDRTIEKIKTDLANLDVKDFREAWLQT